MGWWSLSAGLLCSRGILFGVLIGASNVNLVLLNPLILKCARGPGRNNKALGIKYAKSGLVFLGGV